MKTKQIDLEINRLTMLKNRDELTEIGVELLDELISVKEQLRLHIVRKSFTADEIVKALKDCDHLDDAIMYFNERK